jgi:hypothetical protein
VLAEVEVHLRRHLRAALRVRHERGFDGGDGVGHREQGEDVGSRKKEGLGLRHGGGHGSGNERAVDGEYELRGIPCMT